jgi:hypothetical protein
MGLHAIGCWQYTSNASSCTTLNCIQFEVQSNASASVGTRLSSSRRSVSLVMPSGRATFNQNPQYSSHPVSPSTPRGAVKDACVIISISTVISSDHHGIQCLNIACRTRTNVALCTATTVHTCCSDKLHTFFMLTLDFTAPGVSLLPTGTASGH